MFLYLISAFIYKSENQAQQLEGQFTLNLPHIKSAANIEKVHFITKLHVLLRINFLIAILTKLAAFMSHSQLVLSLSSFNMTVSRLGLI